MSKWAGKTPTTDEWLDILENHAKWLRSDGGGTRADLSRANLSEANLSRADLSRANLYGANLSRADLSEADLSGADLSEANLSRANLSGADLSWANLYGADLSGANISGANLYGANLSGADLSWANLYGANLSEANISGAKNAELVIARTRILPDGDLIAWKLCRNKVVVQLMIPVQAKRSHAFGRKCRAETAVVMAIFPEGAKAESIHCAGFFYEKGAVIKPHKWEEDWTIECGGGIHFYITREEAEAN